MLVASYVEVPRKVPDGHVALHADTEVGAELGPQTTGGEVPPAQMEPAWN